MPKDEKNEFVAKASDIHADTEYKSDNRKSMSTLGVLSIVTLSFLVLFSVGGMLMFFRGNMMGWNRGSASYVNERAPRGRMMSSRFTNNSSNSANQSVASGVVTSINESSFVIGGNGTKVTVNTSGSTTWNTTDKKVSVNDSVVVIGTESNSTITATSVRIANL